MNSLGVGLRTALSGRAAGGWASDHCEETVHNTGFNYVAIHAIAAQVAGATVTVFSDGDQQTLRQARRKSLAIRVGSFSRWKSTYGSDDRETDPLPTSHPLVRLLRHPNPHESGANFRYRQAQQIRLTGTCLIWNVPSISGPTCERYVIPTAMASPVAPSVELPYGGWRINPVASRYTPIVDDGYADCPSWYRILGQIVDARQVQMIRLPHAWYLDDGQSPLSAGAKWVDAGEAVDEARFQQLKNGIDPSVVWNLPPDVSPDQDEIDRVQAKISAKYGGPQNVGRVMVAQSGTSITPLSATPKDMCYTEGFQDFKAAVLALHQTPPVAVGLQEPGAYAAYNASMKAWRHAAIQPLCDMLAESDTEHLAPQFGSGLTVEIESDTVDDTELIEQQLQNDLAAKVRTKNEWRAVRGMPPLPGTQGDALVGTDGDPEANRRTPPNGKSFQSPEFVVDASRKQLFSVADREQNSVERLKQSSTPPQPPSRFDPAPESDEDHDRDDQLRAELIADILYGLYGDSATSVVEATPSSSQKAFDPDLHPRDILGRFARRGSADEIADARQIISEVLQGKLSYRRDDRVLSSLCLLKRSELESLHREHGFTAPPHQRERLVESIRARLFRPTGLADENVRPIALGRHTPTNRVGVYVQNAHQLKQIMGCEIAPREWGQLVGAQPGARVYVYPDGYASVQVAVEHRDYWARRRITKTTIENEVFGIAKKRQGEGLGFRIFQQQVKTATKLKLEKIKTYANGEGAKLRMKSKYPLVGYYAWARFGFDAPIDVLMNQRMENGTHDERASALDFQSRFPGVTQVSEMMLTKERRDWWKDYGGSFEATFDLGKSSTSFQTFAGYSQEIAETKKPSKRKSHASVAEVDRDQFVENGSPLHDEDDLNLVEPLSSDASINWSEIPDTLTPDEEEILDRIWDEIGRQRGVHDRTIDDLKQP